MQKLDIHTEDSRERRCPKLGHDIRFSYCRAPGQDTPCSKIFDCWWETFDVVAWARHHFGDDLVTRLQNPPSQNKAQTIFDLMQQAQRLNES